MYSILYDEVILLAENAEIFNYCRYFRKNQSHARLVIMNALFQDTEPRIDLNMHLR